MRYVGLVRAWAADNRTALLWAAGFAGLIYHARWNLREAPPLSEPFAMLAGPRLWLGCVLVGFGLPLLVSLIRYTWRRNSAVLIELASALAALAWLAPTPPSAQALAFAYRRQEYAQLVAAVRAERPRPGDTVACFAPPPAYAALVDGAICLARAAPAPAGADDYSVIFAMPGFEKALAYYADSALPPGAACGWWAGAATGSRLARVVFQDQIDEHWVRCAPFGGAGLIGL